MDQNHTHDESDDDPGIVFNILTGWIIGAVLISGFCALSSHYKNCKEERKKKNKIFKGSNVVITLDENTECCSICLEKFNNKSIKLQCNHIYHIKCLKKWYDKSKNKECPLCREEIKL